MGKYSHAPRFLRPLDNGSFQVWADGRHVGYVHLNEVHGWYAARLNGTCVFHACYSPSPQVAAKAALPRLTREA